MSKRRRKARAGQAELALFSQPQPQNPTRILTAYFDGSCEPVNPGGAMGWGVVIFEAEEKLHEASGRRPAASGNSNNVAEYLGFMAIIDWLVEHQLFDAQVTVLGDSNLLIQQMFGHWKIRKGAYADIARERFVGMSGRWIPRDQNTVCDAFSKGA